MTLCKKTSTTVEARPCLLSKGHDKGPDGTHCEADPRTEIILLQVSKRGIESLADNIWLRTADQSWTDDVIAYDYLGTLQEYEAEQDDKE